MLFRSINTANSATSPVPITIMSATVTNAQFGAAAKKVGAVKNISTNTEFGNNAVYNDDGTGTTSLAVALNTAAIDWTVNQYIIFAGACSSGAPDTCTFSFSEIKIR